MAFAGEDKEAIDKLWKQGSIRPSTSPWASPIVLVRKKDGKVRTCVDYRRLNSVTKKDAFPIPRVQDCLDAVAGAVLFSTMDITAAYNQIPMRSEDIPKTAFCSRQGLMEFMTMPFGQTCHSNSNFPENHGNRTRLKLKPGKCYLFQPEVTFLGHVISHKGVTPNPDNTVKLVNWPPPSNVTEVRSFVGFATYYRRFVKNFSEIAHPLTNLTKKGTRFPGYLFSLKEPKDRTARWIEIMSAYDFSIEYRPGKNVSLAWKCGWYVQMPDSSKL